TGAELLTAEAAVALDQVFKTRGLFTHLQVQMIREQQREQRLAALTADQAGRTIPTIAVQVDGQEVSDVRRREFARIVGTGATALAVERLTGSVNPDLAAALDVTSRSRASAVAPGEIERLAVLVEGFKGAYGTTNPAM